MKIEINLWELMGKNKMTAIELSKITGISPIQISNIKNGKTTKIGLDTIAKLLKAFDCTPNDLFKIIKE
ncbi:MAG: helix-turn-helix transcriptional regulator [Candidatus Gracilibacteria bacterium]